jgi:hypothetical protein
MSGSIPPNTGSGINVYVNSNANILIPGSYYGTLGFINETNGIGNTSRNILLIVSGFPPELYVSPTDSMVFSGSQGGPFRFVEL